MPECVVCGLPKDDVPGRSYVVCSPTCGEIQDLREALRFYASPEAWEWRPDPSGGWSGRVAVTDGGARARAALAQLGAPEV